jgi:hypothetical protein
MHRAYLSQSPLKRQRNCGYTSGYTQHGKRPDRSAFAAASAAAFMLQKFTDLPRRLEFLN